MIQIPLDLPAATRYELDSWCRLRWRKGGRYYEIELQQDLWGDWVLTRAWGGPNDKTGRVLNTCPDDFQQGQRILRQTIRRRRRDGYQPLTPIPPSYG